MGAFSKNVVVQHFWHGFFPLQITQPLSMPEMLNSAHAAILATQEEELELIVTLRKIL